MGFYIHDRAKSLRFEITGNLSGNTVSQLERSWCTASSTIGSRPLVIALGNVTGIDAAGRELLWKWCEGGAQLVATSVLAETLLCFTLGQRVISNRGIVKRSRWPTFFASALCLFPLMALFLPATVFASDLEPQTARAWEMYVEFAQMRMQQRLRSGNAFLWVDEAPDRLARVRRGEVVLSAIGIQNPKKVPGGLIHDWVGAIFVQGTSLRDVLGIMRDYDRYKNFFAPTVIDSKVIARSGWKDQYSMLFVDKSLFLTTALETDYESCYVHVDDRQGYSVSHATRIQEIEEYGTSGQHVLGDGKGNGFIWRLFNITRYLERDGGVYLELDAIGLSRDIPASLRWVIEPMVRRLSGGSLSTSLRQMANAVQSRAERH